MDEQQDATSPNAVGRPDNARRLFVVIAILAGFGILGGIYSIRTSISQPLAFTNSPQITNQLQRSSEAQAEEEQLLALQNKDSDKDTLADYDELYQYGTSPYLADSDSDGISDKDEVTNGQDPNCPEGQSCSPLAIFQSNLGTVTDDVLNTNQAQTEEITAAELRVTLRNAGASQAELDLYTDQELLALYQDVVEQESTINTNAVTSNTNQQFSDVSIVELRDLTVPEIRELLKLGGADDATLSQIDDATLQAIYLESLQNLLTQ